jgi:YD repeat-containing protein
MGRIGEYEYDCHGRLTQESVDGWQRAYAYDPRGLLLSAEQIGSQSISWVSSWFTTPREEHSIVERSYDADGRLTYESVHLNSELIQETNQEWEPGQRRLRIGDHERTFVYQNNQLTEVVSGKAHLKLAYDRSGSLKSKTTPFSQANCSITIWQDSQKLFKCSFYLTTCKKT